MKNWMVASVLASALLAVGCGGGGGGESDDSANRTDPPSTKANEWLEVAAGEYFAGDDKFSNFPKKKYGVKSAFQIQKFEVTNAQYKKWLDTLPEEKRTEHMPKDHFTQKGVWKNGWYPEGEHDHPVVNVTYADAKAYAEGNGWKLPSRVQWEAAARGKDAKSFPWGNSFDKSLGNVMNGGGTKVVGSYPGGASSCGAMDMCGNVWEYTRESYDKTNRAKLLKGGSYQENGEDV